jgi:hypothetical protein
MKYLKPNGVDQQNEQLSPRQTAPKGFHYKITEMDDDACDPVAFRSAVGALLYLAYITRPDICFYVGYLGGFVSRPKKQHEEMLQGLLHHLKDTTSSRHSTAFVPGHWIHQETKRRNLPRALHCAARGRRHLHSQPMPVPFPPHSLFQSRKLHQT